MEKRARFQFRLRTLLIVVVAINLLCAAWFFLYPRYFVEQIKNGGTYNFEALNAYAKTQAIYEQKFNRYGTLVELRDQGYMDKIVADATTKTGEGYQGFYFKEPAEFVDSPENDWHQLVAHPQEPSDGKLMYLINQKAMVWQATYKGKAVTKRIYPEADPNWVNPYE